MAAIRPGSTIRLKRRPGSPVSVLVAVDRKPDGLEWPTLHEQWTDLLLHVARLEDGRPGSRRPW